VASASATPDSNAKLYRRATVSALIVGPTLLLVDNLLHPTEFKRDHEAKQLAQIADNYTRWQLAHVIGFAAIVVFAAAVLGLAWLVRRRQPTVGLVAGALGIVGLLGLASVITIDGYSWAVLGEVSGQGGADPATIRLALHDVQQSNWSAIYYTVPVTWIACMLILAAALWRQRAVPGWASGLLALGTLMVGTETFIAENAYFIGGAAVMLAGCLAVALPLARMSDGEFARGGPATAEPR
jgi:hypothetical protein